MEQTLVTPKHIARNITSIKRRVPVSLDLIIDFLIKREAVSTTLKQEVDAKTTDSEKIDTLIQRITSNGDRACDLFVQSLEKNKLDDLAATIRQTNIQPPIEKTERSRNSTKKSRRTDGEGMSDAAEDRQSSAHHSKSSDDYLEGKFNEYVKIAEKNIERRFKVERDEIHKQQDVMRAELEEYQSANQSLNDKIIVLERKMTQMQTDFDARNSIKDGEIRRLLQENEQLHGEVETLKKSASRYEQQEETIKALTKALAAEKARLLVIQDVINKPQSRLK